MAELNTDVMAAIVAREAMAYLRVTSQVLAKHLVPITRQILEVQKLQIVQASACLDALEAEGQLDQSLQVPDCPMGTAIYDLNDAMGNQGTKINVVDAIVQLLIAVNGDKDDWEWNKRIAQHILDVKVPDCDETVEHLVAEVRRLCNKDPEESRRFAQSFPEAKELSDVYA